MLGQLNKNIRQVTIIGAGFSGLISACRLLKGGYSVAIHEAAPRGGGLISTVKTEYGPVEAAAHSIRSSPEVIKLFSELGLAYVTAQSKKKYIYRGGRLRGNPLTLWEMFTAGSYAYFKKSEGENLTLAEWTAQHVGPGAVDNAMAPLAHGIYAAEPEELDQQLAFPRMTIPAGLTLVEKIFRNPKTKDKSFVIAPENGMEDLTGRLTAFVENHAQGHIFYQSRIDALPEAGNILIATPASIAGKLIGSDRLAAIRYAPMATATVFFDKRDIKVPPGIGFLNARGEDGKILGVLFNSGTFQGRVLNQDHVSLTVMLGGTSHPDILGRSDLDIETIIVSELKKILDLKGAPLFLRITRWPEAIPLYSAELRETLGALRTGWCAKPGHMLFGNYAGEVSIRGMCQSSLALAG